MGVPMTPAEIALTTAHAFFKDVDEALQRDDSPSPDLINTLSLGSRKLMEAEKLDPDAKLPNYDNTGTVSIRDIKAMGVGLEGKFQLFSGEFKKAIALFDQSIALNPDIPISWASKGIAHGQLMQKQEAIAAFQKAIELDPENIDYHKALTEVQSISGSEIAAAKVISAGQKTFSVMRIIYIFFLLLPFILIIGGFAAGNTDSVISGFLFLVIFGFFAMAYDKVKSFFS
jgi:tetratricopeptide (TPR) repeat protein